VSDLVRDGRFARWPTRRPQMRQFNTESFRHGNFEHVIEFGLAHEMMSYLRARLGGALLE